MYLEILKIFSNFITKILLSVVIIYIAFRPQNYKKLVKQLIIFYLVSFVFGGCVFALMYFIQPQLVEIKNGVFVGAYPIKIAIVGGIVSIIVIFFSFKLVKNKITKKDMIYNMQITIFDNKIKLNRIIRYRKFIKRTNYTNSSCNCREK